MAAVVLRGMLSRKLRTVLTAIAILLGVAMIAGTFVLTDQIQHAFTDIFKEANKGTDAVLTHRTAFTAQNQNDVGPLPESLVQTVRNVPGVAVASGNVQASGALVVNGKYKSGVGGAPNLVFSTSPPPFDVTPVVSGRLPRAHGEVAVLESYAKDSGVKVGDRVGLTTRHGTVPVRVVGLVDFSSGSSLGGATMVLVTLRDAQRWYDRVGQVSDIVAAASPGVSQDELKRRIERVVPPFVKVQTGAENAKKQADDINNAIGGFLTPALLAFAGVAVLVGAFIIFNTFTITVAQRLREFALLRTLGASRRQVLMSVILEAALVGLLASLVGLGAGYLLALGLGALFGAVGFGFPSAPATIAARTVVVALLVGVGVTLVAALVPAVRATRIPPVAALREGATMPPGRFARYSPILAALFALGGVALLVGGVFGSGTASSRLLQMAFGAVLIFIAVAMVAKYLVRPAARVLGWPMARLFGFSGGMAQGNATRNPARTAVTAAALMIGVGLVAFVAVFAQGLRVSFTDALDRSIKSDIIVSPQQQNGTGLPPAAARAIARAPGVQTVSPLGFVSVRINGRGSDPMNGVDPATIAQVYRFDWQDGTSPTVLAGLGSDGALVEKGLYDARHFHVGSRFLVVSPEGKRRTLVVRGVYKDQQLLTGMTVPQSVVRSLSSLNELDVILVKAAPGQAARAEQAVKAALRTFPAANVQSNAEYKQSLENQINKLLYVLYGLLAMSVIISLFGIVNTMVLTIYERTREIGMLRAIGTSRRQVRRMIRFESVITSTIGGILGVIVGVFFGWIVTKGLESEGIHFALPTAQLVIFLIVAAGVGYVAGIFPARRAARLDPLEALHYE